MKIAICVATYRRPLMLAELLESIGALVRDSEAFEVVLVVVDNDADASAQHVLDARRATFPFPIISAVEPRRNIALARNRSVAIALSEDADCMAFVDDDERVSPSWLLELLRVRATTNADIVGGPVINAYLEGTPRWIVESGLPPRTRLPTGSVSPGAETSNVLVSRRVFGMVPEHFDPRFGRAGGSDSRFFLRARVAGARIVWADEAIVFETLPASRATVTWLLLRAFRRGNTAIHVPRSVLPVWKWLPNRVVWACYRVARGLVILPAAVLQGRAAAVRALQDVCLGAGGIAGLAGYRHVEYTRTHGG